MTIGEKIKVIRNFRGLTQKQLGLLLGFDESQADVRIAQYEKGVRKPKQEMMLKIAKTLDVSSTNFISRGLIDDILQAYIWLDKKHYPTASKNYFELADKHNEMHEGKITQEEYFDWAIKWTPNKEDIE